MKTPPIDDVLRSLRAVRQRMFAQTLLATLARGALLLGAALVVIGAARRWLLAVLPWDARIALWAGLAALIAVVLVTLARRLSLPETATVIDRLGQTRDRFVTALAFTRNDEASEGQALAVRECAAFIGGGDFARLVRLRVPREVPYLLVPAVALALLQWEARGTFGVRDAEVAVAQSEVEQTARKLEELARQAEKKSDELKTDELKKIAKELKRSAKELRAEAKNSEQAEKAALREISELEQLVQELQKPPGGPSPEELRELAKALEKTDATKDAATAMAAGDLAKAAEQLEKAMQDLDKQGDERTKEEIEKALKEALEKMALEQQLSEALQKLAQQMKQQGGQDGKSGQMSKELADMLKKLQPQPGQQSQPGSPQSAEAMKNLLAALQNMKFGEGQPGPPGKGEQQPGPGGLVMMPGAGPNPLPGGNGGDPNLPSGQPGSEHDTGTTDSPFGKKPVDAGKEAEAKSLSGRLADGETMQQFLPSAGDTTKSKRRYKELYDAMAPAAQDAVVQENIPLGSRFFIKRYFESIRPKE